MPPEEDQAAAFLIGHFFVINEVAPQIQHLLEHGHVVGLALDDVGEKDIGLARLEKVQRHLFHGQDDGAGGEVLLHDSARLGELFF